MAKTKQKPEVKKPTKKQKDETVDSINTASNNSSSDSSGSENIPVVKEQEEEPETNVPSNTEQDKAGNGTNVSGNGSNEPEPEPERTEQPEPEKPRNKGGRPKGVKNGQGKTSVKPEKTEKTEPPSAKQRNIFDQLAEDANNFAGDQRMNETVDTPEGSSASQQSSQQHKTVISKKSKRSTLINGFMLLYICDFIFPRIIRMFTKKKTVKELKLDNSEWDELEPLADEVARDVFSELDPKIAFLISVGVVYAGKID